MTTFPQSRRFFAITSTRMIRLLFVIRVNSHSFVVLQELLLVAILWERTIPERFQAAALLAGAPPAGEREAGPGIEVLQAQARPVFTTRQREAGQVWQA